MTGGGFLSVGDDSHDDAQQWRGVARVLGPNWAKMPLSTIGLVGLQIVWSVEMSNAPAYLLTLGMSRAAMSVVFLAGPLSGLIVQPIVGAMADASTLRFGRRRLYIMGGAIICGFAMLLLGFTRQFAGIVTPIPSAVNDSLTIGLAVVAIYCIDFAVNAGSRPRHTGRCLAARSSTMRERLEPNVVVLLFGIVQIIVHSPTENSALRLHGHNDKRARAAHS